IQRVSVGKPPIKTQSCSFPVKEIKNQNPRSELGSETGYKPMVKPYVSEELLLDPEMRSSRVLDFERQLLGKVVGQDRAVRRIVNMYQIYLAGMASPGRPVGNLLFLGPTGSGKTRVVEATAEILFGNPRAFIKIDCAEFQHSHEIAKLIGSPPGYL